MRHNTNQRDLEDATLKAILAGDDVTGMSEEDVLAKYGDAQGDAQGDQGDAQGDAQGDQGDVEMPEQPAPEAHPNDGAMEAIIRAIAREEDSAQNEFLHPVVARQGAAIVALREDLKKVSQGAPRRVTFAAPNAPDFTFEDRVHPQFETLLATLVRGYNVVLVGPAGSGKTTAASMAAKALGKDFRFSGAVSQEHKIMGFVDPNQRYAPTEFYRAYTSNCLFLSDEMDAWAAQPTLTINAHIANAWGDFPCGMVEKHKGFLFMAAMNTYGRGASRQYVGRNPLDGATLDRMVYLDWDYDEAGELDWSLAHAPEAVARPWVKRVQALRAAADAQKVNIIISPRASMMGAGLLAAGLAQDKVEDMVIWKGLEKPARDKILAAVR